MTFRPIKKSIGNVIPAFLGLKTALRLTIKDMYGVDVPNPASNLSKTTKHLKNMAAAFEKLLVPQFLI